MAKRTVKKNEPEALTPTISGTQLAESIDTASSLDIKKAYAAEMIKSGLLPETLAVPEQLEDEAYRDQAIGAVIAVVEYGKEIGISPWIALNGIHVVKGKIVMGVHMYMGLALQNKIIVTVIRDYEKVYKGEKLIDYETEIEIERYIEFLGTTRKFHFIKRWTEIKKAGLAEKDNYVKRAVTMLRTRCITEGLRLYAADVYMGTYETSEMADVHDLKYTMEEDGSVVYQEENK